MDWVDGVRSPIRGRTLLNETMELSREQLAIAESRISLAEEKLQIECARTKMLAQELNREKMQRRCSTNCLKVLLLLIVLYLLGSTSTGVSSGNVMPLL